MASLYFRPGIALLMALLYNVDLHILLLHLMIDIVVSVCSSFGATSATVGLSFFNNIVAFVKIIFLGLPLGLCFSAGAFLFNESILSKSHLVNNFAPCSDLSTYGLLAMTTHFVYGA